MPLSEYLQQQAENFALLIDNAYTGETASDRVKVAFVKIHELNETIRAFLDCVCGKIKQIKKDKEKCRK